MSLLEASASRAPDSTAMLDADGGSVSFKSLFSRCLNLANLLTEQGIRRGDRVACAIPTGPAAAEAMLAISWVATAVPIPATESFHAVQAILEFTRSKAILIVNKTSPEVRSAAENHHIPLIQPSLFEGPRPASSLRTAPTPASSDRRWTAPLPDDVALLVRSGPQDNNSRYFPLTHRNLVTAAHNVAESLELSSVDRCLALAPVYETHGFIGCLLASFSRQASVICPSAVRPNLLQTWLSVLKPTWISATPSTYRHWLDRSGSTHEPDRRSLLRRDSHSGADGPAPPIAGSIGPTRDSPNEVATLVHPRELGLRFLRSASEPLSESLFRQLLDTFQVPVVDAYSLSEAGHQISCTPLRNGIRKPGSVGLPTGTRVAVVDPAGEFLPQGEVGEIVVHGESVSTACLGRPEMVRHAFARGWLRTGDLGHFDADGHLFLSGRLNDVIQRGTERILPREIEEVLLAYPGVAQAICFAKAHPTLGQDLVAGVVLREGAVATETGVRSFAFDRLPLTAVPSRILILDPITLGSGNTLRRNSLAQHLAAHFRIPFVPPRDDLEQFVAHIWEETLEVSRIGVDDGFFGLGGDPVQASRIVSRVNELLQLAVPVAMLIRHPTVAEFTSELKRLAHPALLETLAQNVRDLGSLSREEVFELLPPALRRDERITG